jgi:acetyltransferase-like isoleucine patch superfamily enzyme
VRQRRIRGFLASLADPRPYGQLFRVLHYYNYTHVSERRKLVLGTQVRIAPNVSFSNAERIWVGDMSHIGAHCTIWAGPRTGRIILGRNALLGPEVFLTAANYQMSPEMPIMDQPSDEADIIVGDDVWLGARVMVLPGVTIGDGCVVGAASVVTKDLPPGSVAVGNPARIVGQRARAAQNGVADKGPVGPVSLAGL